MNTGHKVVLFSFVVFFFSWYTVYRFGINTLPVQSEDTVPAMFLPYAIIRDRTLYLDSYYTQMVSRYPQPDDKDYVKGNTPFYLTKINGHFLSAFPIVTPILALPVYFLPVILGFPPSWDLLIILSHLTSSLIVSVSGWLFYKLVRGYFVQDDKKAILLTAVYLFGTVNFALLSQSLWQHGTVQLFLLLTLTFFYKPEDSSKKWFLTGLFFGLSILARPTAALPVGILIAGQIVRGNWRGWVSQILKLRYMWLGLMLTALFFYWYNSVYYVSVEHQGYYTQLTDSWKGRFPEGFLGVWLSPSKGILVYSPVILFMFIGTYLALKAYKGGKSVTNTMGMANSLTEGKEKYRTVLIFGAIVLLHTLIISLWKHWYGGWSFGYRMSSDVIPFMILAMIPVLESGYYRRYKKLFIALFVVSVLVQVYGLIFFDGIWHAAYDRGFNDTSWLWSIKDSELAFNIRRVMVNLGLLDKACPACLPL